MSSGNPPAQRRGPREADRSRRPGPPPEDPIVGLAAAQHGVVARSQLLAAGVTARMVQRRLDCGALLPLHRGVYLLGPLHGGLEPEWAAEMAAVLACGPDSAISHGSAARLWGLRVGGERGCRRTVDVMLAGNAIRRRPGIRIHRPGNLTRAEITRLHGIPVTTADRTLRDLSTVLSSQELNRAAARAERRSLITAERLASLVARHKGRPGAPLLRAALGLDGGPALTRSDAEERFLDLVRRGRLPAPEVNVSVGGYELDFLWRVERLAVEVDGFAFHASRHSFENDRRRDAELAAAGIHVVRVTWRQIVREPTATLVLLAQALARSRPNPRGPRG